MSDHVSRIRIEVSEVQKRAVRDVMRSGELARGPHLDKLMQSLADLFGKRYIVLTTNGFSALFSVINSLELDDPSLIGTVSASTCYAMVNAIKATGNIPHFFDLEDKTFSVMGLRNSELQDIEAIVIPDHFGMMATELLLDREREGVHVIEDAAQSFFSRQRIQTNADSIVLSFYPTKWINGVDGGAILTDDKGLYEKAKRLSGYEDQIQFEEKPRFNFSMSNLNAALVLATLDVMPSLIDKLNYSHRFLRDRIDSSDFEVINVSDKEVPSRFLVRVDSQGSRDIAVEDLDKLGIQASKEINWVCLRQDRDKFPIAQQIIDTTMSLPFHPWLTTGELDQIALSMEKLCS